jgi:hypothetical protein
MAVAISIVGDSVLTTPFGFDRPDLGVGCGSGDVDIGYFLTGRRVGRVEVVRGIFGDVEPVSPANLDGVDLKVVFVPAAATARITPLRWSSLTVFNIFLLFEGAWRGSAAPRIGSCGHCSSYGEVLPHSNE